MGPVSFVPHTCQSYLNCSNVFFFKASRKITPKAAEEAPPPFAGMKLKKSSQVKRNWDDDKLETVELKHHEFEKLPQAETPEKTTTVVMSEPMEDDDAGGDKNKKKKKKKKVRLGKGEPSFQLKKMNNILHNIEYCKQYINSVRRSIICSFFFRRCQRMGSPWRRR